MIKVKVPATGWTLDNLADWGTGQIQMSKVADATVVVPIRVDGKRANAHVWLEKSPWKDDGGQPFMGGYVSIRNVEICLLDSDGAEEPPSLWGNLDNCKLVE